VIVSLSAVVAWTLVDSDRTDVNLMFLALIVTPIVAFGIPMSRFQKRLHLECPHCHMLLFKQKVIRFVLEKGQCPNCKEKIINDVV